MIREPEFESENEQLRTAFAEAAGGVRPSPVPLAAIERRGRARRRRKGVGMALAGGLLAASAAVTALHVTGSPTQGTPPAAAASVPPPVVPGQHVAAGYGLVVWLTADGKYLQAPGQDVQFTPKVDGAQTSGVNLQAFPTSHGQFVSGVYLGHGRAARVEVTTASGTIVPARILQLPGDPGWGAFFVPPTPSLPVPPDNFRTGVTNVAVYDPNGHLITTSTYPG